MKFQPGNNAGRGRKKGSRNKVKDKLRESINKFLEGNFEEVQACFDVMPPRDKAKLYCELLQYGVPKLQAINMDMRFENMTNEQLDEIIDTLINKSDARQLQNSAN